MTLIELTYSLTERLLIEGDKVYEEAERKRKFLELERNKTSMRNFKKKQKHKAKRNNKRKGW